MVAGLVLAAGGAERFGASKQLAEVGGVPMLERVLAALAEAPLERTCVVLGAGAQAILAAIDLHGAEPVICAGWADGQSASLRAGLEALADADAVLVAVGDQPLLSAAAAERVLAARDPAADAVRATYSGKPGHPVLLERTLFGELARLEGDVGARDVLTRARVLDVPCDGLGGAEDVDTPGQLEELRRRSAAAPDPGTEAVRS